MLNPLRIHDAEMPNITTGYYINGHKDKDALCEVVEREYGEKIDSTKIYHGYFRKVPHGEFGQVIDKAQKGRGAFPVTAIDL